MTTEEELRATVVDLEATTEDLTIDSKVTTEARSTEEELTVTAVDSEVTTEELRATSRLRSDN